MKCRYCGNEMSENDMFCPTCGAINTGMPPQAQPPQYQQPQPVYYTTPAPAQHNKMSIISIIGFVIAMLGGVAGALALVYDIAYLLIAAFLLALAGIVVNSIGIARCKRKHTKGKGFAIAGLVLSILLFVALILLLVVFGIVLGLLLGFFAAIGGQSVS